MGGRGGWIQGYLLKIAEMLVRGRADVGGSRHMYRVPPKDYEQEERYCERSARRDPNSARAFAGLSFVHWQRAFFELSPDRAGEIARAFELALQSYSIN